MAPRHYHPVVHGRGRGERCAAWGFGARFQPRFTVYLSILQHPAAAAELLVPERGARGAAGLRRDPAQLIRSSG
jgi:hypothetical protein